MRLERILSTLLTIAALAIAVVLVHREFFSDRPSRHNGSEPEYLATWREILPAGRIVGDTSAPVKLIEFADLECPFCRDFSNTVQEIRKRYPNDVAFVFVHLPLNMHRFARPAARAVECAYPLGSFEKLVNVIYDKQDSLGLKTWSSYARDAGIRDTLRFARCASDTVNLPMVEAGIAVAKKMNVTGTPTVVLNGWLYDLPPSAVELVRAIEDLQRGKRLMPPSP